MASELESNRPDGQGDEKELPMEDIASPLATDVLCGRGGAALRHPGNQTYRTLVQLNKGLYITCLKVEKLKISKSIVAAIREQKGRFLEKDKKGTWYDIGDKKATEKTSQALREGQPKLKQKFEELGSHAAAILESQLTDSSPRNSFNSSYAASDSSLRHSFNSQYAASDSSPRHSFTNDSDPTNLTASAAFITNEQYNAALSQQQYVQINIPSGSMNPVIADHQTSNMNTSEMPPPTQLHDMMSQRLSLSDIQEDSVPSRLRPSILQRGSMIAHELGIDSQSTRSFMSDFSDYGMRDSILNLNTDERPSGTDVPSDMQKAAEEGDLSQQKPPALSDVDSRRTLFAKMKVNHRGSGQMNTSGRMINSSERSMGDGMPEIHMLESNMSLYSNVSSVGDLGGESRRSIMSGLSRISDTSNANSMFSDLSKNIGNVSTRSLAMSEFSNLDDTDSADSPDKQAHATAPQPMASYFMEYE